MKLPPSVARERVCAAVDAVLAIELPEPDEPRLCSELAGALGRALVPAMACLAEIHGEPGLDDFASLDPGGSSLQELAFIARLELRHYGGWLLEQSGALDLDELVSRCERLRRQSVRVLCAVEQRLAEAAGQPPATTEISARELAHGRALRQGYYRFIAVIEALAAMLDSGHWGHASVLTASHGALSELLEDSALPRMRCDDRRALARLQARLLGWARPAVRDELEARRLWRAVLDQAAELAKIQRRRDLIEHDLGVIDELLWTAQLGRSLAEADPRLAELASRSPELDAALERGRGAEVGRALARLHDALARILGRPSLAARRRAADIVSLGPPSSPGGAGGLGG